MRIRHKCGLHTSFLEAQVINVSKLLGKPPFSAKCDNFCQSHFFILSNRAYILLVRHVRKKLVVVGVFLVIYGKSITAEIVTSPVT